MVVVLTLVVLLEAGCLATTARMGPNNGAYEFVYARADVRLLLYDVVHISRRRRKTKNQKLVSLPHLLLQRNARTVQPRRRQCDVM